MKNDADLVLIERARSTALAEELQSLLRAEGIESFLDPYSAEEIVSGELYTEFTGVDVKVRTADAEKAKAIVADSREAGKALNALYEKKEVREKGGQSQR